MKISELYEGKFKLNKSYGKITAKWNSEIFDEEDDDYLPDEYDHSKVLELEYIEADDGKGEQLMNEFLNSPMAKSAELIFLDPNPGQGKFKNSEMDEDEQFEKLYRFYKRFGFESKQIGYRMWKVQKGTIKKEDLPT